MTAFVDSALVYVHQEIQQECVGGMEPVPRLYGERPTAKVRTSYSPCAYMRTFTVWTFVTRDGSVYTLRDSVGARPVRVRSLWGAR